jgi:hypothetical protein
MLSGRALASVCRLLQRPDPGNRRRKSVSGYVVEAGCDSQLARTAAVVCYGRITVDFLGFGWRVGVGQLIILASPLRSDSSAQTAGVSDPSLRRRRAITTGAIPAARRACRRRHLEPPVAVRSYAMGLAELEAEWRAHDFVGEYKDWNDLREEFAPLYLHAIDEFLDGGTDVPTFRGRIDSLSKAHNHWGFRGTGQMFFNQLVKAAEPSDLADVLRAALPAPTSPGDAEGKLEQFLAAVDRARERADATGRFPPVRGRINFFVSFFWELRARDEWPTFFPNSRNILEQHGLLDTTLAQPALYLAYRARIQELKERLGATTWGVEHLLWRLGKGASDPAAPADGATVVPTTHAERPDVYTSYRAQGLHFSDMVVTSLVLSLASKRFAILSGISGTGKTQLALGLARHLDSISVAEETEIDPPVGDASNVYIKVTAPRLRRARTGLDDAARAAVDDHLGLPDPGASKRLMARLPDGSSAILSLYNDPNQPRAILNFLADSQRWLQSQARLGDILHLKLSGQVNADLGLDLIQGATIKSGSSGKRHVMVAVRSDWTDPRGLLGFFNPLTSSYATTSLVNLLLRAAEDPEHPYVVVLDEMNLARVEYYFSDFLSALESGEPIELMAPGVENELLAFDQDEVPGRLDIPANVSFVGTVNIDETTHAFSPKVLDRANVIEFNDVDIERALGHPAEVVGHGLRLKDGRLNPSWLCTSHDQALAPRAAAHEVPSFTEALEEVHALLTRFHLHFGYRVIDEVSAFVGHALGKTEGDPDDIVRAAFDLQLQQKILPKLAGGRELEEPLARLLAFCLPIEPQPLHAEAVRAETRRRFDPTDAAADEPPRYPGSARKLLRMLDRLSDTGFVGALE